MPIAGVCHHQRLHGNGVFFHQVSDTRVRVNDDFIGGVITEVEEWGKKKLAYEIQKMHEGFYYFIQFEADAQCPAEIERHVRIMDNVLRYLVVRKDA